MTRTRTRLTVLVLPEHSRAITQLARERGESVAAVVRGLIRDEALRQGCWTTRRANGDQR